MPVIVGGGGPVPISLLPVAPTALDGQSTFPTIAGAFMVALYNMVMDVDIRHPAALDALPPPPNDRSPTFAAQGDTYLASFSPLIADVNALIDSLDLACSHVSALPTAPTRSGDPVGFLATAATFLAALTPFRTQMNAFINALNDFDAGDFTSSVGEHLAAADAYSSTLVGAPATSAIGYITNSSATVNVPLPASSAAGDGVVIFVAHGWMVMSTPTGWNRINRRRVNAGILGNCYYKNLSSADVTAGSVSFTFQSSGFGIWSTYRVPGGVNGVRAGYFMDWAAGAGTAASRAVTSEQAAATGDTELYFGAIASSNTITVDQGSADQSSTNASASGVLKHQLLSSAAQNTATYSYSPSPVTNQYSGLVSFAPYAATATRSWSGAPGYIASGHWAHIYSNDGELTFDVPYPADVQAGDAVLLVVHANSFTTPTLTVPGFTLIDTSSGSNANATPTTCSVYLKNNLDGSERTSMASVTYGAGPGNDNSIFSARMHLIAGVKLTGTAFEGAGHNGSSGNAVSPSVTTTGPNRRVFNAVFFDKTNGLPTVTAPAGYTNHSEVKSADGYGSGLVLESKVQATAGTVGASTTTLSTGPFYGVVSFALIPETP